MKRRRFVQLVGAASASHLLACSSKMDQAVKGSQYMDNLGLQIWTVRNQIAEDPVATLKAISEHGYQQIELMNLDQLEILGPIAKDFGLDINCSHINWTVLTGRWDLKKMENPGITTDHLIEKAHKHGISHMIYAYWFPDERSSLDDYKVIADKLNRFGEDCNKADVKLGYHNHSFEFKPMEDSTGWEVLMNRVEKDKMFYELDVFWASIGNQDALGIMEDAKDKIGLLHLKDRKKESEIQYDESKVAKDAFKEVGQGMLDFKKIIVAAEAIGVEYCHVEQDESPDPLVSIGQSQTYLKTIS